MLSIEIKTPDHVAAQANVSLSNMKHSLPCFSLAYTHNRLQILRKGTVFKKGDSFTFSRGRK